MVDRRDIQGCLPLTETTFLILLSLLPGSRHGYAMIKDVHRLSQERILISTGTLYGALKRLLEQGWIARVSTAGRTWSKSVHPGRARKAYVLTDLGRRILDAEVERLRSLIAAACPGTMEG